MVRYLEKRRRSLPYRCVSLLIVCAFVSTLLISPGYSQTVFNLPVPGVMVPPSPGFTPALVKGMTVHPENPLQFDFIVDPGDSGMAGEALIQEANTLIKYFLASLTVPEKDLWVNLSPYEKDRIIPDGLGKTEMGRDLLAQDYLLKQLTASLIYPEDELGKTFWSRVYAQAQERFGTTDIPVDTFNKVWIVPEDAVVYEKEQSVFVVNSHLKVMLEEDYLNSSPDKGRLGGVWSPPNPPLIPPCQGRDCSVPSELLREIVIPAIEKEVNEGKNFAALRQIYNSMILAVWYKQTLKESLLAHIYMDQNKVKGVDLDDPRMKQKIYAQYLASFKQGVYNYIKEELDPKTQEIIPRKYFSGGLVGPKSLCKMPSNPKGPDMVMLSEPGRSPKSMQREFAARLGTIIQRFRIGKGWTQEELAEEVGVIQETVSRWERGEEISATNIEELVKVLGEEVRDKAVLVMVNPPQQQFAQDPGVAKNEIPVGGINLDPALLNLQIKRDGKGMPLPVSEQPMLRMTIEGVVPVIINVTPVNLPLLLGLADTETAPENASRTTIPAEPASPPAGSPQRSSVRRGDELGSLRGTAKD